MFWPLSHPDPSLSSILTIPAKYNNPNQHNLHHKLNQGHRNPLILPKISTMKSLSQIFNIYCVYHLLILLVNLPSTIPFDPSPLYTLQTSLTNTLTTLTSPSEASSTLNPINASPLLLPVCYTLGLVTSLSPCTLGLLPITLTYIKNTTPRRGQIREINNRGRGGGLGVGGGGEGADFGKDFKAGENVMGENGEGENVKGDGVSRV